MEEVKTTKKRFRPTLTAYRELEAKVDALTKTNEELQAKYCKQLLDYDNKSLRIESLKVECESLKQQHDDMVPRSAYDELLGKYETLEKSNKFVEDGQITLRKQLEEEVKAHKACQRELYFLKNRSFWKRVFNINK